MTDCTDLLYVAVQAILQLAAQPLPATDVNIWTRMATLCPASAITLPVTQATLTDGLKRGVLTVCKDVNDNIVYEVNYDMVRLHADNEKYFALLNV